MTDLVKRLRDNTTSADMSFDMIDAERREAADEIERLRKENDELRTALRDYQWETSR